MVSSYHSNVEKGIVLLESEMKIIDLKEGDKLYSLVYRDRPFSVRNKRQMRQVAVSKVKNKRAYLKGGYQWTITEKMFMTEWFPSKFEAYNNALKKHLDELEDLEEDVRTFRKEVKYLKRKIKESEMR
jgi:hypothetical protein